MTCRLPVGNESIRRVMPQPWSQPDTIRMEPGPLGWRSGKWENTENDKIRMGNWVENSYDTNRQRLSPPLPGQISNYFRTTYDSEYCKGGHSIPVELRTWKDRYPRAFPGHQPELDPHYFRTYGQIPQTTSEQSYQHPNTFSNWSANLLNFGPAGWRPRHIQPMSNMAHCYRTSYGMDFNKEGCQITETQHTCPVRMTLKYPSQPAHVEPFLYQNYSRCFPPLYQDGVYHHPEEVIDRSCHMFDMGKGGWRLRTMDRLSQVKRGRL